MKDFLTWLAERGKRTALGCCYPLGYATSGVGQNPPLDSAPVSASHLLSYAKLYGDAHPELLSDPIRKEWEKTKKDKKGKKNGEKKLKDLGL